MSDQPLRLTSPSTPTSVEPPGLLRAVAIGSLVGIVLAMLAVTGALLVGGSSTSEAVGIGAMAAFWGGLGFGSMVGGVIFLSRVD
jgi:hypothetical protein